jgi:hypothetical protein
MQVKSARWNVSLQRSYRNFCRGFFIALDAIQFYDDDDDDGGDDEG